MSKDEKQEFLGFEFPCSKTPRPLKLPKFWIFTPEVVWTQDANGTVLKSCSEPRRAYEGHFRATKWDQLHLAYFAGYALWNYVFIPFALAEPGFEAHELKEHWEPGLVNNEGIAESWSVLDVTFREKLWISRMDYATDIAKETAAHYCLDHKMLQGLVVLMLRRAVSRIPETDMPMLFDPSVFLLNCFAMEFEFEDKL